MQTRSLTQSAPGSMKTSPRQKTYYIPPPPPPTKFPLRYPQVPIYSSSNNSYDPGFNNSHRKNSSSVRSWPSTAAASPTSNNIDGLNIGGAGGAGPTCNPTPTSRYIHMLLSIDTIPKIYNLLAAFSTWILLAGYVLLPGTFTSIQNMPHGPLDKNDPDYDPEDPPNAIQVWILERVRNTPLLYVATACSAIGVLGMCALWFKWRRNYVWILNRIFLPGMLNSLAGIISTVVNVHTAQQGKYSLTAIITVVVTASSTAINGILWLVYNYWALRKVQELHRQEYFDKGAGVGSQAGLVPHGENGNFGDVQMHLHKSSV
ncbi:hypothetical protein DFH27DRAFT_565720 [Peziza echinospora]|nr:hypothetical protein DFH27DRAFT_565720 [Peziza echinospora]